MDEDKEEDDFDVMVNVNEEVDLSPSSSKIIAADTETESLLLCHHFKILND